MKIISILPLIFLMLHCLPSHSSTLEGQAFTPNTMAEKLSLKTGIGVANRKINASNSTSGTFQTAGFHTQICYDYSPQFELGVASYIYIGNSSSLDFEIDRSRVKGSGEHRSATFSPYLKYISSYQPASTWHLTYSIGPAWSLQTFKLNGFRDRYGTYRNKHKITYQSFGGVLGIGLMEVLPSKQMNPLFFELLYSYMSAHKATLVDINNFTEVQTITQEDQKSNINGNIFMFNVGITLF